MLFIRDEIEQAGYRPIISQLPVKRVKRSAEASSATTLPDALHLLSAMFPNTTVGDFC
jgi:hypothetical protein